MRLVLLIVIAWLGGWLAYVASVLLISQEGHSVSDLANMGFYSLVFGLPFCLIALIPGYALLQVILNRWPSRTMLVVAGVSLSALYMGLLIGSPLRSLLAFEFHLFAAVSASIFALGYLWAVAPTRAVAREWAKSAVVFPLALAGYLWFLPAARGPVAQIAVEVPAGFRGNVCVALQRPDCPPLPRVDGRWTLRFDDNGYLCTSDERLPSPAHVDYFFVGDGGRTPMPPALVQTGGSGEGGYQLLDGGVRRYHYTGWFIGSREDLENLYGAHHETRTRAYPGCAEKVGRTGGES